MSEMRVLPDTLVVEVTQDDIRKGRGLNPSYCPIALAARRALGDGVNVEVGSDRILADWFDRQADYQLPHVATEFVIHFDHAYAVAPFTFTAPRIATAP